LPGGKPLTNSAEMLNSQKMARLVEELKARYPSRIILFDLPPLLGAADALAFSPYVDAALLVVENGKTQKNDVKQAIGLLQGTKVIGTVLNKSSANVRQEEGGASNLRLVQLHARAQILHTTLTNWFNRLRRKKS
jgi:Mrp family chromosome partitioning ATPase